MRAHNERTRFDYQRGDFHPRDWHPRTQLAALAVAGGTVYYVYHLERVPVTGRWRFMDVTAQEEYRFEMETYKELVKQYQGRILDPSHPTSVSVRQVVSRLLDASELGQLKDEDDFGTPGDTWNDVSTLGEMSSQTKTPQRLPRTWKLLVVNDPTINAMASYGTIVVFLGILPFCANKDGLAAVIGHEIAHVVARHSAERLSSVTVFTSVAFLIDFLLQSTLNIGGLVTTLALQLPNSRKQELEADLIGLTLTARACFDPLAASEYYLKTGKNEGVGLLNTHPLYGERIQFLESLLPDAYAIRAASPSCAGMEENLGAFVEMATSDGSKTERSAEW
ncbi:peptidase family M48-domain-containing protein [Gautieria morchelliformis]|nr:peptidase family M48-domain-containing protein [Gautieria morchelliformis]